MNDGISFEQYLERHGSLTYSTVGVSMRPMLRQGKDLFTVVKKGDERCKVGDVVLYRREPNERVLHRVVKVLEGSYVILGDNCVNREYGVTDDDILGVMTGFVRGGRPHSVKEPGYRAYTRFWLLSEPLRVTLIKTRARVSSALRSLGKRTK